MSIVFRCTLQFKPLLKTEQLCVDFTNGEFFLGDEHGDGRVVVEVEVEEDVGDQVIVVERLVDDDQLIT
jgi:hypothetical protein